MSYQEHHVVPHLQSVSNEEIAPTQRHGNEQPHAALDDAAWVKAIREGADGDREGEKRQPIDTIAKPASNNPWVGLAVRRTLGPSAHANSPSIPQGTSFHRPGGDISELRDIYFHIGF